MTPPDIMRVAKLVTVANAALFAGALITAMATFLSVRYSDKLEKLKDREYTRLHMQDQQKICEANTGAVAADSNALAARRDFGGSLIRERGLESRNRASVVFGWLALDG